jgi:hypothetical protein
VNWNSHGARLVHLIITMIKWIRTSRLPIKNSPPPCPAKKRFKNARRFTAHREKTSGNSDRTEHKGARQHTGVPHSNAQSIRAHDNIQGYLTDKKVHPPRTLPQAYA